MSLSQNFAAANMQEWEIFTGINLHSNCTEQSLSPQSTAFCTPIKSKDGAMASFLHHTLADLLARIPLKRDRHARESDFIC